MSSLQNKLATAVDYHKSGDLDRAESLYREVVRIDPAHADALHLLGVAAHQRQQHATAVEWIQQAIAVNRTAQSYHCNLGAALRALGRLDEAVDCFREALRLDPGFAGAQYNLGMTRDSQGNRAAAIEHFREAIRLNPQFADAYNNLGIALTSSGECDEAISCFRQAIRISPGFSNAYFNLGNVLHRAGRLDEAIESFRASIRLNPGVPEAHNNLGLALQEREQCAAAATCFEQAVRLNPRYAAAYSNLGSVRQLQQDWDGAIASFQQATRLSPHNADLYYNLATALQRQKRIGEATETFRRALEIDPRHAGAHFNLALIYEAAGECDLAKRHFEHSLAIEPKNRCRLQLMMMLKPIFGSVQEMLQARHELNANLDTLLTEEFTIDAARKATATCFYTAYHGCADRPLLEKFDRLFHSSHVSSPCAARAAGDRLRIGFASAYFRNHTIGRLMQGVIARLPRCDFHVTVLATETSRDEIAQSIRGAAEEYVELTRNVGVGVRRIAEQDLDILFYADLGMDPVTYSLARNRLAPVQCVTWGHPVTTGMRSIDYFLSSELAEPESAQENYTETLVLLKSLPTYYHRPAPSRPLKSRRELGLPETGAIYLCPQSLFKIHPEFDELLAEILRRDPTGQIVFIDGMYSNWTKLLRQRFERTIAESQGRILFLQRQSYDDFLNLIQLADVMLDPIHFGGGNTNYEAMAFGVPVVTLPSPFLRGRVALALYRKMGVLDCVAQSFAEYVELAVGLGTDPARRNQLQRRLLGAADCLFEDAAAVDEIGRFLKQAAANSRTS